MFIRRSLRGHCTDVEDRLLLNRKGENRFIGREGDGHCFLACSKNYPYWLFAEGSKNHRRILCNTSKPFAQKTANRTSKSGAQKILFSSRQRTGFRSFNGKSAWIRIQTFASSTRFSWLSSFWLLFISKPEDLARGKEISVWWGGYRRCEWVF